jgi:predicted AAA+ superfamily ATPase
MKPLLKLPFIEQLSRNLLHSLDLIQVILGPRQVGKTTGVLDLIEHNFPTQAHYVSADKVFSASPQWLTVQWNIAQIEKKILFVDEIQKCENWSEVIKKLYDQAKRDKKKIKVVLLGSSSLEIHKGLTESLTGRFQLIQAFHWNSAESQLGYKISFDFFLKFGGYPGAYPFLKLPQSGLAQDWFDYVQNSIVSTVIEKDILQYQSVKSPSLFRQAFEIICSYPAQEISYTKLLGQIQDKGNVELIKNYLRLYEGAYLIKILEKYSGKKIVSKSSSPKIILMAPALYQLAFRSEYSAQELGRVFESVVGSQLIRAGFSLYYWREGNYEVDFIAKDGKKIFAIEVKSGRKKSPNGLIEFQSKYPDAKIIMITLENYQKFEKDPRTFIGL